MAASLEPSAAEALSSQLRLVVVAWDTQVLPESVEVQMLPPATVATSLPPSAEEAMERHEWMPLGCEVQTLPASVDVKIDPPLFMVASLVPSADEAIAHQLWLLAWAVQFESADKTMALPAKTDWPDAWASRQPPKPKPATRITSPATGVTGSVRVSCAGLAMM